MDSRRHSAGGTAVISFSFRFRSVKINLVSVGFLV